MDFWLETIVNTNKTDSIQFVINFIDYILCAQENKIYLAIF